MFALQMTKLRVVEPTTDLTRVSEGIAQLEIMLNDVIKVSFYDLLNENTETQQCAPANWGEGFVECFLRVPQAVLQLPGKGNFQKTHYKTFFTICRNTGCVAANLYRLRNGVCNLCPCYFLKVRGGRAEGWEGAGQRGWQEAPRPRQLRAQDVAWWVREDGQLKHEGQ